MELQRALREAREEKKKELAEATNYANDESSNSLRDKSNSSLHEFDNTLNNKEDYHNSSDYKLGNSLLDYIIDILKNIFN